MNIYLVGLSGSGKTTIGKKLSEKLNMDFIDTDDFISLKTGFLPGEFIKKYGEDEFRIKEKESLKSILESKKDFLVSTGGGLPIFHGNMDNILKTGVVVYIKVSPKTSFSRIKNKNTRPLSNTLEDVENIYEDRKNIYKKADIEVDGNKTIDLILKEIEVKIKERNKK